MKEINFLLRFYTQSQLAEILGYKNRSSVNKMIKSKKIPTHKKGLIEIEYKKCKEKK